MSEVAHDHQVQVKKYVREELHLKNSSDTWHGRVVLHVCVVIVCMCACVHAQHNANAGTKGAAKAMNKIAQGPLGTTWFRQLSDKRMSVSCHTVYIHVHVHIHGIYRHV